MKEKNFVSCVIYLHNDREVVRRFLGWVCRSMKENFERYEIICVNDGCTDDTILQVRDFLEEEKESHVVSLINLSYYQGVENAMNAGRDLAVGDFLFEFDSCVMDFEETLLMEVYRRSLTGYDVVAAAPLHNVSWSSKIFYMVYNWGSKYKSKIRQERFRIVSRRAINRVNQMNAYIPYRKALYASCGLKMDTLLYDNGRYSRKLYNKEERGKRSGLAFDTIIIFTNVLEKLSILLSVGFMAMMLFTLGNIVYTIFGDVKPVEGWLSTICLMSVGFFMLFVMLTMIFKYLSVILNMMFRKQRYVIEGVEKLTK